LRDFPGKQVANVPKAGIVPKIDLIADIGVNGFFFVDFDPK